MDQLNAIHKLNTMCMVDTRILFCNKNDYATNNDCHSDFIANPLCITRESHACRLYHALRVKLKRIIHFIQKESSLGMDCMIHIYNIIQLTIPFE